MCKKLKVILLAGLLTSFLSCKKNENLNSTNDRETESVESIIDENGDFLSINSNNLEAITNEFKVDFYKASDKYGGNEINCNVGLSSIEKYTSQSAFFYKIKEKFNGMPIIEESSLIRLSTDLKSIVYPKNEQGYIQLTEGNLGAIYGADNLGENNNWYLIYNKKKDLILTGSDFSTELIAGYIRLKNNVNVSNEIIDNLYNRLSEKNSELLNDLKSGNLYYAEFKKDESSNIDSSAYLLPCELILKGTLSKDIKEVTSAYGISKIDVQLVGTSLIDTKWFIDKNKMFNKQIK